MAKAYVIGEVTVHDAEAYAEYSRQVPATIEQYGGRFWCEGVTPPRSKVMHTGTGGS